MFVCLFGGLLFMTRIPQEVMPDFSLDTITVTTMYAGASPSEIESGVLLAIEDSISGLTGVDEVTATAKEGKGVVIIDVIDGQNIQKLSEDVQRAINRITTFPVDADKPQVAILETKRRVISMALYGDAPQKFYTN